MIEEWTREYNQVPPHSTLGYRPSAPEVIFNCCNDLRNGIFIGIKPGAKNGLLRKIIMKRLVIGIDIDGVIVDFGSVILPLLSEVCARPVMYQDLCSWDLSKALNIDEEIMANTWKQILDSDLLRHAPPIKGAIEGLSVLSKHEIWLVTSRSVSMQNLTSSWLHDNKVSYNQLVFDRLGNKHLVGPTFDVFVEDFIEEAYTIAEAGISTILFDQPWNKTSTLPKNCKRVYEWNAILSLIGNLEEKNDGIPP